MDIKKAFGTLLERWWVVALTVLIGIGAAIAATTATAPQYTSRSQLFVSTTGGTSSTESFQGDQFSQQRASSYAQILTSEILGQRVADALDLPLSGAQVASKVTAAVVPKTVLLDVSVLDSSADRAADIANSLSREFISYIVPLETPAGQEQPRATITVVNPAEAESTPTSPVLATNLLYGVAGGFLIGVLIAIALAAADSRVKKRSTAQTLTNLPVLGPVEPLKRSPESRRTQLTGWTTRDAEAYRKIRVHLQALPDQPKVILVTSSSANERTSGFALDLAAAFAESEHRTLLVETDSARPAVSTQLGLMPAATLADALGGQTSVEETAAVPTATPNQHLDVIPVGANDKLWPLLSSYSMRSLIYDLRASYSYIVIDTPPIAGNGSAAVLAGVSDGTLLVIDTKAAKKKDVSAAVRELAEADARPIAAVLTNPAKKR